MYKKRLQNLFIVQALLLSTSVGVFCFAIQQVFAGALPSALSPNTSIKAAVYQGVVAIAPTTAAVLELGNAGRDIAGSSDLYLRPNGLAEAQGAHIVSSGTVSDLYVSSLCLYGTGSEVCQSGVPSGGSDTFWTSVVQSGSFEYLTPNVGGRGVQFGSQSAPVLGKALEINTNNVAPAITVTGDMMAGSYDDGDFSSIGSGAVSVSGRLQITKSGVTQDTLRVGYRFDSDNYAIVWSQAYQGRFTGLDADTFDGTTSVLFSNVAKKDFFWKDIVTGPTSYGQALCVHSEFPNLCSIGGAPCATAGAACPSGQGTCTALCKTTTAYCANNTSVVTSHSVPGGNCGTMNDSECQAYCPGITVCTGKNSPPGVTCPTGSMGDEVKATTGTLTSCGYPNGLTVPWATCNCKLVTSTPIPYNSITGAGNGDLCTAILN